jgi:ElaB/YqjD/DUF883 family membrane-anchored ribosome-binding protein
MKSTGKAGNGHEDTSDFVEEALHSFQKKATDFKEKNLDELADELKTYVKENPLQSVLIAAGAGLLLGLFLKRR